jgi:hypothetical protein
MYLQKGLSIKTYVKNFFFCCPLEVHCLTEQDSHPDPDLDLHQNPLAVSIRDPYQTVTDPEHCIEGSKRKYTGSTQMAILDRNNGPVT